MGMPDIHIEGGMNLGGGGVINGDKTSGENIEVTTASGNSLKIGSGNIFNREINTQGSDFVVGDEKAGDDIHDVEMVAGPGGVKIRGNVENSRITSVRRVDYTYPTPEGSIFQNDTPSGEKVVNGIVYVPVVDENNIPIIKFGLSVWRPKG